MPYIYTNVLAIHYGYLFVIFPLQCSLNITFAALTLSPGSPGLPGRPGSGYAKDKGFIIIVQQQISRLTGPPITLPGGPGGPAGPKGSIQIILRTLYTQCDAFLQILEDHHLRLVRTTCTSNSKTNTTSSCPPFGNIQINNINL